MSLSKSANVEEVAELRRRIDELESRMTGLASLIQTSPAKKRWWLSQVGAFGEDPVYDEINRLGREWRQSQVPEQKVGG